MGDLRIKTDQPGAAVTLDNRAVGQTPLAIPGVVAGKHRIKITKPGYADHSREFDFKPGKTGTLYVVLERADSDPSAPALKLPVTLAAIHRHAAGHCVGHLTIRTGSIEYEASDGREAIRIPVRELTLVARDGGDMISAWALGLVAAGGAASAALGVPVLTAAPVMDSGSQSGALLPVRLETSGPKYSFWMTGTGGSGTNPPGDYGSKEAIEATRQMFDVVNRLYRDDLKTRPKKRGRRGSR